MGPGGVIEHSFSHVSRVTSAALKTVIMQLR